ncbi:hypothetical protein NL676_020216 [Syzygium grande]|nr:hypothetical protein NL676_020216 [Syzygium grande]
MLTVVVDEAVVVKSIVSMKAASLIDNLMGQFVPPEAIETSFDDPTVDALLVSTFWARRRNFLPVASLGQ